MALSFRDEIDSYMKHTLEQQPMVHEAMTQGKTTSDLQASINYIGACLKLYQDTILMIADEIDKLRASAEGR